MTWFTMQRSKWNANGVCVCVAGSKHQWAELVAVISHNLLYNVTFKTISNPNGMCVCMCCRFKTSTDWTGASCVPILCGGWSHRASSARVRTRLVLYSYFPCIVKSSLTAQAVWLNFPASLLDLGDDRITVKSVLSSHPGAGPKVCGRLRQWAVYNRLFL
jgi:hypothetical protein